MEWFVPLWFKQKWSIYTEIKLSIENLQKSKLKFLNVDLNFAHSEPCTDKYSVSS